MKKQDDNEEVREITREMVYKARDLEKLKKLVIEHCADTIGYLPSPQYALMTERNCLLLTYVLSFMPQEVISYVASHVAYYDNEDELPYMQTSIAACLHKLSDDIEHNIIFDSEFRFYNNKYRCSVLAHETGHAVHGQLEAPWEGEDIADDFGEKYGFKQKARQPLWKLYLMLWQFETPLHIKILTVVLILIVIGTFTYLLLSN